MTSRRNFLTSLAALPLPLTLPWIAKKVEPTKEPTVAPQPEAVRCACGDVMTSAPELVEALNKSFDKLHGDWDQIMRELYAIHNIPYPAQ